MRKKVSSAAQTETPSSIPDQMDPQHVSLTLIFLKKMGIDKPIPQSCDTSGFYSHFFGSFIKVNHIKKGRISCIIAVKPPISNAYGTLHGGSVGSYIELLSTACARTVIAEDKELFLGEINVSYLSGAPISAEVLAEASVVKSGRNVTMVALEFKLKKTGNLMYIACATFYNIPVAKL
ncbi:putative esterase F42H10.6 [Spatholobus suberectus]|nr:putative esterase F42H10.6 [Spatholobus suberectus]